MRQGGSPQMAGYYHVTIGHYKGPLPGAADHAHSAANIPAADICFFHCALCNPDYTQA
jgi:hypothetical protein